MKPRKDDIVTLDDVLNHIKPMQKGWDKKTLDACIVLLYATLNQNFITSSLAKRLPFDSNFIRDCVVNFRDNGLWFDKWANGRRRTFWRYDISNSLELGLCGMCGLGELVTNKLPNIIAERNKLYKDGCAYRELPEGCDTSYQQGDLKWYVADEFWAGRSDLIATEKTVYV